MSYNLRKAETWEEIEAAVAKQQTCIGLNNKNWARAKQTWEVYHATGDVVYYWSWPTLTLGFPSLRRYPYSAQSDGETTWKVVLK